MHRIRTASLSVVWLLALLVPGSSPRQGTTAPRVGADAPAFDCNDWAGARLSWASFEERAVLVFFHAPALEYSKRAFAECLERFSDSATLRERVSMLLVLSDASGVEDALRDLERARVDARLALDPERTTFAAFRVIAFPSAFCVTPAREIAASVKGYGPRTTYRIQLGCELAAGLLDRAAYDRKLAGETLEPVDPSERRRVRYLGLARKLLLEGQTSTALSALLQAEQATPDDVQVLSILIRALLQEERLEEARGRIERFASIAPGSQALPLLRARVALLDGRLEDARAELSKVGARQPEARFLRGLVLEAEGRWEAAARQHRRLLEPLLWSVLLPAEFETRRAAPDGPEPARAEAIPRSPGSHGEPDEAPP